MGRHKKEITAVQGETALAVLDTADDIELIQISPAQQSVVMKQVKRITKLSSRIQLLEREVEGLTKQIKEDPITKNLKERKAELKTLRKLRNSATDSYNGALEFALSDTPGETLRDKLNYLQLNP